MYPGRRRVGRDCWVEHKNSRPPRVGLRRTPHMYVVSTAQALPSPRDCRPNGHCGRSKELPEQLHNEPEMAHWGCLYQWQCAAQGLASSFAMGPALEVERVPWPAGAVRGVEWPSQTTRLCISYPPQGGGFMQPRIWTRNRVQIHRFEMGGKGGARAHTIS